MGRNRKNGSVARFVPAAKAALLCLLLGGSAIGYVYQKNQIIELGRQFQLREKRLRELSDDNAKLNTKLLTLQNAKSLDERVKSLNLGLVQPIQSQILTIVEAPAIATPRSEPLVTEQPQGRIAALK